MTSGRSAGVVWRSAAVVLVAAVLAATSLGCSGGDDNLQGDTRPTTTADTVPPGFRADGDAVTTSADAEGGVRLRLPGVGSVEGGPGSMRSTGTLTATPVTVRTAPTEIDGVPINKVGPGLWARSRGVRKPLAIRFSEASAGEGESLIAIHRSDDGTWSVLPDANAGSDGLTVRNKEFSFMSWATTSILQPVGDFLAEKLAGRTEPSTCRRGPGWAAAIGNPSGSTHSCVRAGRPLAEGTEIAELEIKSNRGLYQWVQVPANAREYVWVEGQPDVARKLIATVSGSETTILLPPGKRMTIGYRQPVPAEQFAFHTYVDTRSAVLSMTHLMFDAMVADMVDSAGGWVTVVSCYGVLELDPLDLENPAVLRWPNVFESVPKCLFDRIAEFKDDPARAATVAEEILGGPGKINPDDLTALTQSLYRAGTFAAVIGRVLSLASYILKELAFLGDALAAGIGADNASDVTLTLDARPRDVVANGDGIAGVGIDEPPGALMESLTARLGAPDEDTGFVPQGCDTGADERSLRWGALTVSISDHPTLTEGPVLNAWVLDSSTGDIPPQLRVEPPIDFSTTWSDLAALDAVWDQFYGTWELGGLYGDLSVPGDNPVPGATVEAFGAGATGLLGC